MDDDDDDIAFQIYGDTELKNVKGCIDLSSLISRAVGNRDTKNHGKIEESCSTCNK